MADITLTRPEAGRAITVAPPSLEQANARLLLDFAASDAEISRAGDNLIFRFGDGAEISLENFYTTYNGENIPEFQIDGQIIAGADFFSAFAPDIAPAAGAGAGATRGGRYNEYGTGDLNGGLDHLGGLDWGMDTAAEYTEDEEAAGLLAAAAAAGEEAAGLLAAAAGEEAAAHPLPIGVSLTATPKVVEGQEEENMIVYTATLSVPSTADVTVTLSNDVVITIPAGAISADSDPVESRPDDVYRQGETQVPASITGVSGGSAQEILTADTTPAVTYVNDDVDVTTVKLTATKSVPEDGTQAIIYTAAIVDAAGNPVAANNDVTVTLSNGTTIIIPAKSSSFDSEPVSIAADEDVYRDLGETSARITAVSEENAGDPGRFEQLVFDKTPAFTAITDTITSVKATAALDESGFLRVRFEVDNTDDHHKGGTEDDFALLTGTYAKVILTVNGTKSEVYVPIDGKSGEFDISELLPEKTLNGDPALVSAEVAGVYTKSGDEYTVYPEDFEDLNFAPAVAVTYDRSITPPPSPPPPPSPAPADVEVTTDDSAFANAADTPGAGKSDTVEADALGNGWQFNLQEELPVYAVPGDADSLVGTVTLDNGKLVFTQNGAYNGHTDDNDDLFTISVHVPVIHENGETADATLKVNILDDELDVAVTAGEANITWAGAENIGTGVIKVADVISSKTANNYSPYIEVSESYTIDDPESGITIKAVMVDFDRVNESFYNFKGQTTTAIDKDTIGWDGTYTVAESAKLVYVHVPNSKSGLGVQSAADQYMNGERPTNGYYQQNPDALFNEVGFQYRDGKAEGILFEVPDGSLSTEFKFTVHGFYNSLGNSNSQDVNPEQLLVVFYRGDTIIGVQQISSSQTSGQSATLTIGEDGLTAINGVAAFDKAVILAVNNGSSSGQTVYDNSDFLVNSASFTLVVPILEQKGTVAIKGADGVRNIALEVLDLPPELEDDGYAMTHNDATITLSNNEDEVVFTMYLDPTTHEWTFTQFQSMPDGFSPSFTFSVTDNDGDTARGSIDVTYVNSEEQQVTADGQLVGGDGDDSLFGGAGDDMLYGGAGADNLYGGDGNDYLDGGAGADKLYGGDGSDLLVYDAVDMVIRGGNGVDFLLVGSGEDLDTLLSSSIAKISGVEFILSGEDVINLTNMAELEKAGITVDSYSDGVTLGEGWQAVEGDDGYQQYTNSSAEMTLTVADELMNVVLKQAEGLNG